MRCVLNPSIILAFLVVVAATSTQAESQEPNPQHPGSSQVQMSFSRDFAGRLSGAGWGPTAFPVILPLNEQVIRIPMVVTAAAGPQTLFLEATLYLPAGPGPFPLLVLSHGTPRDPRLRVAQGRVRYEVQSWEFVNLGFAVVIPMRRGYGHSQGEYAELEGDCDQADFYAAGMESARDLLATVRFMRTKPFIDHRRIILAGHSTGGFASLALASLDLPGVLGVINFGGGRGSKSDRNCSPFSLIEACRRFGSTSRVPTLWLYCENDTFFPPWLAQKMYQAYAQAGGKGNLVMLPPFGEDGHFLFTDRRGAALWPYVINQFLAELGFARPRPVAPAVLSRGYGPRLP
jgi:pimeloyl-ACP methyl ester carboxylesterase